MAFEWHQKIPLRLKLIGQDILLLPGTSRRTRLKYHLNIFQEFKRFKSRAIQYIKEKVIETRKFRPICEYIQLLYL